MDYWVEPVEVDGQRIGEASFRVPGDLPLGWHTVHAESDATSSVGPARRRPSAPGPGGDRGGPSVGLHDSGLRHAVGGLVGHRRPARPGRPWPPGAAATSGPASSSINPLHAASPVPPMSPSPYLPVTRRFANPMYLRIEDVPEYGGMRPAVVEQIEQLAAELRRMNATADLLDRDAVWAAKRTALEAIHRAGMTDERGAAYASYPGARGRRAGRLRHLVRPQRRARGEAGCVADRPRPSRAQAVAAFREEHADLRRLPHVDAVAPRRADGCHAGRGPRRPAWRSASCTTSPVGVAPGGLGRVGAAGRARPRRRRRRVRRTCTTRWGRTGASRRGVPTRWPRRRSCRSATCCGRCSATPAACASTTCSGLFRLWWVPQDFPAYAGTFVRFDYDAMLSILMLEAHRAGALVVGEDLGTVEPWVQEVLAERGILGTSILWFETVDGVIRDPFDWRRDVLASVTVHDLPPTAGYLRDEHVRIRAELGLLDHARGDRARPRRPRAAGLGGGPASARLARLGRRPGHRRGAGGAGRRAAPRGRGVAGSPRRRLAARRRRGSAGAEPAGHRPGVPELAGSDDRRRRASGDPREADAGVASARAPSSTRSARVAA